MKVLVGIFLLSFSLVSITGCQKNSSEQVTVKLKSKKEQKYHANYSYSQYKKAYDEVLSEAQNFKVHDDSQKKWIIRTLVQEKLYDKTDLSKKQVVQLSKQEAHTYKIWKAIALDKYHVHIENEKLDRYINKFEKYSPPSKAAFADSLGITKKELDHKYDRDMFEQGYVWSLLRTKLEKQYRTADAGKLKKVYEKEVADAIGG
ncbi:hypothetical protein SAMN05443252_10770 [Bacillus sp. OV322]|uniref:hypothetical protein n=1 Tax=Bacillus sp. OV322 TaxID=1882764 RepID=UPI0008F07708|nr:hypothetical protein [Bacillus sp. OV322]SFC85806.1 hypothetical protein SAMN05443252_10770 [Bacillus sp. OV322]